MKPTAMRITERTKNTCCTANSSILSNPAIVEAGPNVENCLSFQFDFTFTGLEVLSKFYFIVHFVVLRRPTVY